jgi:hypothetical protein
MILLPTLDRDLRCLQSNIWLVSTSLKNMEIYMEVGIQIKDKLLNNFIKGYW